MLSAVVFDFDGIILDSETPEYEAHRRIFERCGLTLTREDWCQQIGAWSEGQNERWFARVRGREGAPESIDAFAAEKSRLFAELVSKDPMTGILDLLAQLKAAEIPTAVATSSPSRWVVPWIERRLAIRHRFGAIVTGDDVTRRKPAPDVYLEAVRRLGAEPVRSIAIEDSGPGIAAARAAGLRTIAIPHWLTESHDFAGADLRVAHAGELTLAVLIALVSADS